MRVSKQKPETETQRKSFAHFLIFFIYFFIIVASLLLSTYSNPHCCGPQVLSPAEQTRAGSNDYNFDHPDAFDFDLLTDILRKLKQGKSVKIPVYDFTTHGRQKEWVRMNAHTWQCTL